MVGGHFPRAWIQHKIARANGIPDSEPVWLSFYMFLKMSNRQSCSLDYCFRKNWLEMKHTIYSALCSDGENYDTAYCSQSTGLPGEVIRRVSVRLAREERWSRPLRDSHWRDRTETELSVSNRTKALTIAVKNRNLIDAFLCYARNIVCIHSHCVGNLELLILFSAIWSKWKFIRITYLVYMILWLSSAQLF